MTSKLFSPLSFSGLHLKNRTVRSATADAEICNNNEVQPVTLERYQRLAENSLGMIITGDFPVIDNDMMESMAAGTGGYSFEKVRIAGMERIAETIHAADSGAAVIAQLAPGFIMRLLSDYPSPFGKLGMDIFTEGEIGTLAAAFAAAAVEFKHAGFDGVQIHAAHGGPLSLFLSPFTNNRKDRYADPITIFREIRREIAGACEDFPVLIKMNCTDYMPGGLTVEGFHPLARGIASAGYDAIEVSGGIWDCLSRTEEELGFPPRPSAEAHTDLGMIKKQSYFRPFVRNLDLPVPVILAGGNHSLQVCEDIIESGDADLVSFCRPLICEPDMIKKWERGHSVKASCSACNACLYRLYEPPEPDRHVPVRCIRNADPSGYRQAISWRDHWVKNNFPGLKN